MPPQHLITLAPHGLPEPTYGIEQLSRSRQFPQMLGGAVVLRGANGTASAWGEVSTTPPTYSAQLIIASPLSVTVSSLATVIVEEALDAVGTSARQIARVDLVAGPAEGFPVPAIFTAPGCAPRNQAGGYRFQRVRVIGGTATVEVRMGGNVALSVRTIEEGGLQ